MLAHKRPLAAIIATAALAVATLTFAAPGNAAPYVKAPTLSVSTTSPCEGESLTVTGTDFVPGSTVQLTLQSTPTSLGSVVVNANGGFTATVKLPAGVTGTHEIVAAGPPTPRNPNRATATITIRLCPVSAAAPPPSRPGPAAFTGADIAGLIALVVVLMGAGGAFVYIGRRRKSVA